MSNKTSDENVANIKHDLKILEEFAEICKAGLACYDQTKEGEAIEHILAELEQKDKRIQELEEELIFIKARQIKTTNNVKDEAKAKIYDSFDKIFYDDIDKKEKLQAILDTEEFINRYDCGKYRDGIKLVIFLAKEQINSIPKQVVIDKIEEYKDKIEQYNEYREQDKETDVEYYENIANTIVVQVLQELLERKK